MVLIERFIRSMVYSICKEKVISYDSKKSL
jgi:hypothetical protein